MFSIDLRDHMSRIGDQGRRPTCVAFALTACHEFHYRLLPSELSKDSLHWGCVRRDGPAMKGVSATTAIRVLELEGQHFEEAWPYRPDLDEVTWESLQPPDVDGQPVFKVSEVKKCEIKDPESLHDHLRKSGPLFVIVPIWSSFFLIQDARIPLPDEQVEEFRGYHAICIVGLTKGNHVLIRNSWGITWGKSGYGIMPFEYLKKYGQSLHSIKITLER